MQKQPPSTRTGTGPCSAGSGTRISCLPFCAWPMHCCPGVAGRAAPCPATALGVGFSVIRKLSQLRSLSLRARERAIMALFLVCVPRGVSRSTDALDADGTEMSLAPNISFMLSTGGYRSHQVLAVPSSFVTDVHVSWQKSAWK